MLYNPPAFRMNDDAAMLGHIEAVGFGSLVSIGNDGPLISHLPLLLRREGDTVKIVGHLSKGNRQWRETNTEQPAVAVFMGADGYISPGWYASKKEHGKVVPTWNYSTVHATGTIRFIDDRDWLLEVVDELTQKYEGDFADPWAVSDAPDDFIAAQLKGIVGVELTVTKLEGKRKLSQNRPEADQEGVLEGLEQRKDRRAETLLAAMKTES